MMEPLVSIRNLRKYYQSKAGLRGLFGNETGSIVKAIDHACFDIYPAEILGLIGESGSGKTTMGKLLMALEKPEKGSELLVDGTDVACLRRAERKAYYRKVQMIFQDPFESINPRFTVYETVAELIKVQKLAPRSQYVSLTVEMLERCGLRPARNFLHKYPHELSGGERQRLSIARALVVHPKILVADEPVSMLDVSIKAGVLNLLRDFSSRMGVTILYISHDLSTVKYLCDRTVIFYLGKIMEIGPADLVIDNPLHPYAKALKASIPIPDPGFRRDRVLSDTLYEKSFRHVSGCRYHVDCAQSMDICSEKDPPFREIAPGRSVACHLY